MQELGFWFINDVVWYKKNPTPNFKGTRLTNSHETLIWAGKGKKSKPTFNYKTGKELNLDNVSVEEFSRGVRKQMGSVWRMAVCQGNERLKDSDGNKLHTTQKPEELLERVIALSSRVGDVVLDPFGGTMTSGAVAKRMGRQYIMIERDPTYIPYGKERLKKIKPVLGDIENAVFDVKPVKAKMEDMISAGFFTVGEGFYLKDAEQPYGVLMGDGKLLAKTEEGTVEVDMHTGAARAKQVKANRVNGFDVWYVKRDAGFVPIRDVRENYRKLIV